ncbi:MAG: thymidylate kinase [Chloroflexi bacterium]|nr:thymidylate kinase [Chloroflexota bacterium]
MAVFISFEGGEGSGKSTQASVLTDRLTALGIGVEFVHEPGTTELGWQVRDILKRGLHGDGDMSDHAELLLFSAARAELVLKVLQPLLSSEQPDMPRGEQPDTPIARPPTPDTIIIADRYVDSTTAYQGYGRGIPLAQVEAVNALATQGIMPDLTFLLDLPPVSGLTRIGNLQLGFRLDDSVLHESAARAQEGARFEEEPLEFHERVRQGYRELAAREPDRFCIIDAAQPQERVSEIIWAELCRRFF